MPDSPQTSCRTTVPRVLHLITACGPAAPHPAQHTTAHDEEPIYTHIYTPKSQDKEMCSKVLN